MKTQSEMEVLLIEMSRFASEYTEHNTAPLIGDFYVWKNALRALWIPQSPSNLANTFQSMRGAILPWPDSLHIGLNGQEALIKWAYTIFLPIWLSGFPDASFQPFKMRPIRRVSILSFVLIAWRNVRKDILAEFSARRISATRSVFISTLLWIFEEAVPLVLDSPSLLVNGNIAIYADVLRRLLPLFIRLQKKNYVALCIYILGALPHLRNSNSSEAFELTLPHLSSEDLELFHSLLRATTRFQDTQAQVSRKALLLTARSSSGIDMLRKWKDIEVAVNSQEAEVTRLSNIGRPASSSIADRYNPAVTRMTNHLRELFDELFSPFNVSGSLEKMQGQKSKSGFYTLFKGDAESSNQRVLVKLSEALLPPQLWRTTHIRLNTTINISEFQTLPAPALPPPRKRARKTKVLAPVDLNVAPEMENVGSSCHFLLVKTFYERLNAVHFAEYGRHFEKPSCSSVGTEKGNITPVHHHRFP